MGPCRGVVGKKHVHRERGDTIWLLHITQKRAPLENWTRLVLNWPLCCTVYALQYGWVK